MASDTLVNVKADTAEDFLDAAHKAMKDRSKLGETTYEVSWKFSLDADKKITKATATLSTAIKRVHYAGAAKVKPDKANADAIAQIEKLNKAHEEAHRDGYNKAFAKNKPILEKELVGKTEDEAQEIVAKMDAAMKECCEALHRSGGLIEVKTSGGKVTVTEKAEGAGGCE